MTTHLLALASRTKNPSRYPSRRHQRRFFLESLEDRRLLATVVTDQLDYSPGETAFITASDFKIGEAVTFQVLHTDGTLNTGSGHDPWTVTDGSAADLDGQRDGNVSTNWYVDPDDSLNSTFALTALGLSSGLLATTTFTDSGGDFSLDFIASEPHSYNHATGGGAFDDRTVNVDVRESLEGHEFACNDIVTFFVHIQVEANAVGAQTIELDFVFDADTTGQSGVGYSDIVDTRINYGVIEGGVGEGPGGTDAGISDDGGSIATLFSETLPSNPGVSGTTNLLASIRVDDLEANESVILRIDVRLFCAPNADPTGNVQAHLDDADVVAPVPDAIPGGVQTIVLSGVGEVVEPASKSGTKFHDLDGDGVRDPLEPGLANWEIRAYADDGDGVLEQAEFDAGPAGTDLTDANGDYTITGLFPGDYVVVEVLQAGWLQSSPGGTSELAPGLITGPITLGANGYAITLDSGEVETGNDFGNYQDAIKSGTKFNDLDGDGVRDAGDPGLMGWTINLSGTDGRGNSVNLSMVTDASGNYSFSVAPGTYTVSEVQQAGWTQSYPDIPGDGDWDIVLTSGQLDTGNDFGNIQNAIKSGTKFHDLDGDGVRDAGEPGLVGWTISLVGTTGLGIPVNTQTVTDASGNYSFSVAPGTYTVSEIQQAGWTQSYPDIPGDGDWDVVLTSGQSDTGNDFGNFQNATKSGTKFHDLDGDGVRDAGEPTLAGWTINLVGTTGLGVAVNMSTVTDASGNYSFSVAPGTYTVSEVQQAGWIQSSPDIPGDGDWDIVLTSGQVDTGNDFGNFQNATKSGTKFNDLDGDGVRDAGEPGLVGWTISLVGTTGLGIPANTQTVTDASGNYSFSVPPGTYTVSEVQQAGWTQSFPDIPGDGDWDIVLTSGQLDTGNDFGNFQNAIKSGTKFNDLDGDGVRDAGEPGLVGWTISLVGTTGSGAAVNTSTVTDASGNYTFAVAPGTYTVSEVQQAGWIQSYPDIPGDGDWDIVLTSGQLDTGNDFGNFQNATKSGTKFNDLDGDGVRDAGEPGLVGWTINLVGTTGSGVAVNTSTVTDASGNYSFSVAPGTYTVSEVQQAGWIQSSPDIPGDGDWDIVLTSGQSDTGNDFGNFQNATKSGTKFNDLDRDGVRDGGEPGLVGWTISLVGTTGLGIPVNIQTVTDASGNYTFTVAPGTYTVSEVQQAGWTQSYPDIPGDGDWDIVLTSGQIDNGNDFGNFQGGGGPIVIGPDKSPTAPAPVLVLDRTTGEVLASFLAYEANFLGGTRVATGDLTGDGIDEIITAPGRGRAPEVRVFTQEGVELTAFRTMAYATTFKGGVQVAVGDVNGDGLNDIITAPSYGKAEIRVFLNQSPNIDPIANTPYRKFNAFSTSFIGGATVRAADMGTRLANGTFVNTLDGKAEIIVGSGPGIKATVKVFHVNATPVAVRTIYPFSTVSSVYKGGVNLDVADLTGDAIPDLVIGSENGGNSRVETWVWNGSAQLVKTGSFTAYADSPSKVAPTRVAALDSNSDDIADQIATVQGPNGTTQEVRIFDILTVNPLSVSQSATLAPFPGPYFIAAIRNPAPEQVLVEVFAEGEADDSLFASPVLSLASQAGEFDLNGDGAVTPSDALLVVNHLNRQSSTVASDAEAVLDVNGDGRVSALDAMLIVNELNETAVAIALAPLPQGGQSESDRFASDVDELFAGLADGSLLM